jgi:hypothetical protein
MGDPASSKKKTSDNTAIAVIAVDRAANKYLVDGLCHKLNLRERWLAIRQFRRKWMNQLGVQGVFVGYEKYGMQSDIEYFEEQMTEDRDIFPVKELNWSLNSAQSKPDRVQRLVPDFMQGRFFMPAPGDNETTNQARVREAGEGYRILRTTKVRDHEGNIYSLTERFLTEYLNFPAPGFKDDLIDCCSRLHDMEYLPAVLLSTEMAGCLPDMFVDS